MKACPGCGQPADRGWTGGARGQRCLVCETALLFQRPPAEPAKRVRRPEQNAQACKRWRRHKRPRKGSVRNPVKLRQYRKNYRERQRALGEWREG